MPCPTSSSAARINAATSFYALHLTLRRRALHAASWRSIIDMQLNFRSCALATDRSAARLNRVESLALSAPQGQTARYPNPYFQSAIRSRGSLARGLLFRSPRAAKHNKIRVFVNSFTGEGSPPNGCNQNADQWSGSSPTYIAFFVFDDARRAFEVLQYNRFARPCKPPFGNGLQGSEASPNLPGARSEVNPVRHRNAYKDSRIHETS